MAFVSVIQMRSFTELVPRGNKLEQSLRPNGAKITAKGSETEPKDNDNASNKSADPRSGLSEHLGRGEAYLPHPPLRPGASPPGPLLLDKGC